MPTSGRSARAVLVMALLSLELVLALVPANLAGAQSTLRDYPVPGGWFYSQESRDPSNAPFRGYTIVDDPEAAFWTEFRRYGGVEVLGYPVSRRYRYPNPNGLLHQAFQRGILQWRPETGRAVMANVFEQFTEQGLDDALEVVGVPKPQPATSLPFEEDAERRMTWLTEPRFLARFFFDPMNQVPFETQDEAWMFFGLPQTYPDRPVYLREKLNGKYGPPLYQPYIVQRFQKGGMEFFLEDQTLDPTIVPGDGKKGCVTMTATGRLARQIGAGRIIPGLATAPEPTENPPKVHFVAYIPPLGAIGQQNVQFELVGTGFDPGEPVTIRLVPSAESGTTTAAATPPPTVVSRVDAAGADGSFDTLIIARVATYNVVLRGERSGKTLDATGQDPTVNLAQPTGAGTTAASKVTTCF